MERPGGLPVADFRRPGRAWGSPRRFCLILVLSWAVSGAGLWVRDALVPQMPDGWIGWVYSVPSGVSLVVELMAAVLFLSWVILPVLVLGFGFDYLRSAQPTEWGWRAAWIGIVGAGLLFEVLLLTYSGPIKTPDRGALVMSFGFMVVGALLAFLLVSAARLNAADHPRPGNLSARQQRDH